MLKEGLGESSEFSGYHPIVNLTYYVLVAGVTMFSLSPWFLAVTFILAWSYSIMLRGTRIIKMNLIFVFWTVVVMAIINVLFTHDGKTVMFYINGNGITVEALIFGISGAVMLSSIMIWFTSFNVIMTAEKLIYIFGRTAPVLGLTLSMIFRYIPLLKERFEEIHMGQECMKKDEKDSFINKVRKAAKNVSVLISWSLESSVENADSMEARGYGLKGRTSFHLYRFSSRDAAMEVWMCLLGALCIAGCIMGKTGAYFYPVYVVHPFDIMTALALVAFALLLITPQLLDINGERKWKRSDLTT